MKKYPNIVQALFNLEKASEGRSIERNRFHDYAEWLELIDFNDYKFPILDCIIEMHKAEPIIYFRKWDTSPFVYLNLN